MTLVQDYKNWKNASSVLKKAELDLNECRKSMTDYISFEQMHTMLDAVNEFNSLLPQDRNQPDYAEKYVEIYEKNRKNVRAPYCFFKVSFTVPNVNFVFHDDEVSPCPNNHSDGHIEYFACQDCPHFEKLKQYQSLAQTVFKAKREKLNAKQKLMSNFGIHR